MACRGINGEFRMQEMMSGGFPTTCSRHAGICLVFATASGRHAWFLSILQQCCGTACCHERFGSFFRPNQNCILIELGFVFGDTIYMGIPPDQNSKIQD